MSNKIKSDKINNDGFIRLDESLLEVVFKTKKAYNDIIKYEDIQSEKYQYILDNPKLRKFNIIGDLDMIIDSITDNSAILLKLSKLYKCFIDKVDMDKLFDCKSYNDLLCTMNEYCENAAKLAKLTDPQI